MSGKTSYHGFNTYGKLEDWDYDPDFSKLDERLERRGSNADRPSSAPDGAKYTVTNSADSDYGARYVYDSGSSSWVKQPLDTPTLTAPASGNVEIQGADLDLTDNRILNVNDVLAEGTGTSYLRTQGTAWAVRDDSVGAPLMLWNEGGPVEVRNANLVMNGSAIQKVGNVVSNTGTSDLVTDGSGSGFWGVYDSANNQRLMKANEGGPIEVQNADLVANGSWIEGTGNGIRLTGSTCRIRGAADSTQDILIQSYDGAGFVSNVRVSGGGPVEVKNANFDLNSHANEILWNDADGDGNQPGIYVDSNGEVVARDDAGNTTVLTNL